MATIVVEESRSATYGDSETTVERKLRVTPYSARLDVVASLLGGVRILGRTLIRIPPARDPWLPFCFCNSVREVGIGSLTGSSLTDTNHLDNRNTYSAGAELVATYKTLDYDAEAADQNGQQEPPQEIDLASEAFDFSAQALTLPNQRMGWNDIVSPSDPVTQLLVKSDMAATKVMPRIQYQLTRHFVARLQIATITKQLGRINKSAFTVGRTVWPVESLRFESLSATRKVTNRGIKFFEVTHKFACNPIYDKCAETDADGYVGWNRLFRPDTGKWQYVGWASNPSKRIYDLDEDAPSQSFGGREYKGFKLLFHPRAA